MEGDNPGYGPTYGYYLLIHEVGSLMDTDYWPVEWDWRDCKDARFTYCEGNKPWYSNVDCLDYPACRCYQCAYWHDGGAANLD